MSDQSSNRPLTSKAVTYKALGGPEVIQFVERTVRAPAAGEVHFRYKPIAGPEELGNGGRIQWASGRPGEAPAYAGTDFIIARHGRIAAP